MCTSMSILKDVRKQSAKPDMNEYKKSATVNEIKYSHVNEIKY